MRKTCNIFTSTLFLNLLVELIFLGFKINNGDYAYLAERNLIPDEMTSDGCFFILGSPTKYSTIKFKILRRSYVPFGI